MYVLLSCVAQYLCYCRSCYVGYDNLILFCNVIMFVLIHSNTVLCSIIIYGAVSYRALLLLYPLVLYSTQRIRDGPRDSPHAYAAPFRPSEYSRWGTEGINGRYLCSVMCNMRMIAL